MVREVRYATVYKTQDVTDAELQLIKFLYLKSMKVAAVKFSKEQYGLGLYEAKLLCEAINIR